ncbi:hypothetical protein TREES_T100004894 [Tupaia chinensis]|uniref:Uncharacterized protein n=1 Tax=Tupaia chinensis TaxID=246437 RepID=L9LEA4_TUPCH|nr:hypothetical protein TREES_T100004894 [Tupaia chinensis]
MEWTKQQNQCESDRMQRHSQRGLSFSQPGHPYHMAQEESALPFQRVVQVIPLHDCRLGAWFPTQICLVCCIGNCQPWLPQALAADGADFLLLDVCSQHVEEGPQPRGVGGDLETKEGKGAVDLGSASPFTEQAGSVGVCAAPTPSSALGQQARSRAVYFACGLQYDN